MIGEATLVADVSDGTISGEATSFVSQVDRGPAQDFDGRLAITGGEISGSEAFANMAGTLESSDHRVTIGADMAGDFLGNPEPLGIELGSVGGTATLDGEVVPSVVTVVAGGS